MKNFIAIATVLGFMPLGAFAADISNLDMIVTALSSEAAKKELSNRVITDISASQTNIATTWIYTLNVTSTEAGLGVDGPSTHPCFTKIETKVIGGFAGNTEPATTATTVCAQNAPR